MVTQTPKHGEKFKIGERITVTALHTPCHTQDSICYYAEDGDQRAVFTGDTLFIGGMSFLIEGWKVVVPKSILTCYLGCGRFFEGTAQEMHTALNEVLASLPDDTVVYVCCLCCSAVRHCPPCNSTSNRFMYSLAMNTPNRTSNSAQRSPRVSQSRNSRHSRNNTTVPRASSPLETRRYAIPHVTFIKPANSVDSCTTSL